MLVVDDDNGQRMVLKIMLSKNGYQVDTAEDGDDAVKAAHNVSYDIILMDGCMPNKTGLEAAEEIRADEAAKGLEMEDRSPFFILLFSNISRNEWKSIHTTPNLALHVFQMHDYRSYRHLIKRVRYQVSGGGHV